MGTQTATAPQINLLTKLAEERSFDEKYGEGLKRRLAAGNLSKADASQWITYALGLPKKSAAVTVVASPWAEAQAALADLDVQFYAIPADAVAAQDIDLNGNDYLFLRLRNYGGKKYLARVFGSYGAPRYQRIGNPRTQLALAKIMATDEQKFAENWHAVSGNCGRCNATLTDVASREAGFGPDCLKIRAARAR